MSRKSSVKRTNGTKKNVKFDTSPPHRKNATDKEYEGDILETELHNIWSRKPKDFKSNIIDTLEDEYLEQNPFHVKNKDEMNKMRKEGKPKVFDEYMKQLSAHNEKMNEYVQLNYKKKKEEMLSFYNSKNARTMSHYYKIRKIDELPLGNKKPNITISNVPRLNIKHIHKDTDPTDTIQVRRAGPVPKKLSPSIKRERKMDSKTHSKAQSQSRGLFSLLTESARKLFGKRSIGGRKRQRTQKRH